MSYQASPPTERIHGPSQPFASQGEKILMKGNEAIAEGAIRGGCQAYFGYPITPQTEALEYMSRRMPELGRVFLQAESEVAAINMVLGAACAGARAMTASSGPGISLKQEGISYMVGCELPGVIVNVMRCGPGLGGVLPAQADYSQATKGGGHGDHHTLVLAPASVQEAMDFTALAFDLADKYRNPVVVLADGLIGQIMEPVELKEYPIAPPPKPWALTGAQGRPKNLIKSLRLQPEMLETHNRNIGQKYEAMARDDLRWGELTLDDAELAVVAFGTPSRVVSTAVKAARQEGVKVGMFRPITLFPFPNQPLAQLASRVKAVLVVELSLGQLAMDVKLAVGDKAPVKSYNRLGGMVPAPPEIVQAIKELARS